MTCYHPVHAYKTPNGVSFVERGDILRPLNLPCGQCWGCRLKRAQDWEVRIMHEASLYPRNCAITLTYGRNQLPPNASLAHRHFQLFMKRLRKAHPQRVRFYVAGEYGPLNQRPHYHACLFNIDFDDRIPAGKSASGSLFYQSPTLDALWGLGRTSVQDLIPETAAYAARYIMKKQLGKTADYGDREPEYNHMSKGIGKDWIAKYADDVYLHDHVIMRGAERRPPKYYDNQEKRTNPDRIDQLKADREQRAQLTAHDQTPERLAVRETVLRAKMRNQARNLDHDAS